MPFPFHGSVRIVAVDHARVAAARGDAFGLVTARGARLASGGHVLVPHAALAARGILSWGNTLGVISTATLRREWRGGKTDKGKSDQSSYVRILRCQSLSKPRSNLIEAFLRLISQAFYSRCPIPQTVSEDISRG